MRKATRTYTYNGKEYTISELVKLSNDLTYPILEYRLKKGWDVEKALNEPYSKEATRYQPVTEEEKARILAPDYLEKFYTNFMNREYGGDIRDITR